MDGAMPYSFSISRETTFVEGTLGIWKVKTDMDVALSHLAIGMFIVSNSKIRTNTYFM